MAWAIIAALVLASLVLAYCAVCAPYRQLDFVLGLNRQANEEAKHGAVSFRLKLNARPGWKSGSVWRPQVPELEIVNRSGHVAASVAVEVRGPAGERIQMVRFRRIDQEGQPSFILPRVYVEPLKSATVELEGEDTQVKPPSEDYGFEVWVLDDMRSRSMWARVFQGVPTDIPSPPRHPTVLVVQSPV